MTIRRADAAQRTLAPFGIEVNVSAVGRPGRIIDAAGFSRMPCPGSEIVEHQSNSKSRAIDLLLGNSDGHYSFWGPFKISDDPSATAIGDLDRDGTPDVVVASCTGDSTGVLLSGTQLSVQYQGLSLTPGQTIQAAYEPDGNSKYGASISSTTTFISNNMHQFNGTRTIDSAPKELEDHSDWSLGTDGKSETTNLQWRGLIRRCLKASNVRHEQNR